VNHPSQAGLSRAERVVLTAQPANEATGLYSMLGLALNRATIAGNQLMGLAEPPRPQLVIRIVSRAVGPRQTQWRKGQTTSVPVRAAP
jgi:hypothetical protein